MGNKILIIISFPQVKDNDFKEIPWNVYNIPFSAGDIEQLETKKS